MRIILKLRLRYTLILLGQCGAMCFALYLAFLLRFDFTIPPAEYAHLRIGLVLSVLTKLLPFRLGQLHRGWTQYIGMRDLLFVLGANTGGAILFTGVTYWLVGPQFPRSIYVLDFLASFLTVAAMRSIPRLWREWHVTPTVTGSKIKRILVYGAGQAGATLVREIRMNPNLGYQVAGFLDDDVNKIGTSIMGLPVVSVGRNAIHVMAALQRRQARIDEIIIAMPSANGVQMHEAVANCRAAGVPCKTVPGIGEVLSGKVLSSQLREVSVFDLLGRDQVQLDEVLIRKSIKGRSILVTGAAGSIGSEICRQVATFVPSQLILFEQAESDLFRIHNQLLEAFPKLAVHAVIGDIRDYDQLTEAIGRYSVESVFHAAAYKHVPLMETHVLEAVRNNVLGTFNIAKACARKGVSSLLMISSDKAVNPANVMGATKRIAELIVGSMGTGRGALTKCVSVRFGNVLGSNGSVIPVFKEQIAKGGPVTVTHPEMTRYFMTIPEAVHLVLQASAMGQGSQIFVLDMGAPVKILDLARNMIRLSGHEPDKDIEIRFTGLRPGEKLYEELSLEGENILPTYHEKIKIFQSAQPQRREMEIWLEDLMGLLTQRDEAAVLAHMCKLVPEYSPSDYAIAKGVKVQGGQRTMSAAAG